MQSDIFRNSNEEYTNQEICKCLDHTVHEALIIKKICNEYDVLIAEVFDKIKAVQGIANKTNLLAINASIETIHASDLLASFEQIVTHNLYTQAKILAAILEYDPDFMAQDGLTFGKEAGIEEFFVTDEQGIVKFTNNSSWKNDTLKSGEILRILKTPDLEISLPATGNGFDGQQFKVVAIARKDQLGIIQLGAHFIRPKGQLAINGFGVVAQEAKRLADVSKEISFNITTLTSEIGDRLAEISLLSKGTFEKVIADAEISDTEFSNEFQTNECKNSFISMADKITTLDSRLIEIKLYFKKILSPLKDLINIARQTNLLGVRAAIEAAHSTNDKKDFDDLLNTHMAIEAKLSAILIERWPDITCDDISKFSKNVGIGEFWITDEQGVVEVTNVSGGKGFIFQNEGQTAPYIKLLSNPNLIVTAPPSRRALDNNVYKYVGVARKGKNGIVQIGTASKLYGESTAKGFSVVANQIKILSEQSRDITTEIETIIEKMDFRTNEVLESIKKILKQSSDALKIFNS